MEALNKSTIQESNTEYVLLFLCIIYKVLQEMTSFMWKHIEKYGGGKCMQHPIEKLAVINERKTMRENILRELYDYYFENKANAKTVTLEEYRNDEERYLACEYLKAKGLIDVTNPGGRNHALHITVYGIDVVENN